MGDKRLMDNKVLTNPLLSGVNQPFLQEFVHSSLLVPAAPPSLLQPTVDPKSAEQEIIERNEINSENRQQTAVLPTSSSQLTSKLDFSVAKNQQLAQPVILQPNQNTSIKASSLTEIPLDRSASPNFVPIQTSVETVYKNTGPPPLTSYNRSTNRLPSSRYPSSTFLQTIPSAQFLTRSNPNTPSISPSNSSQNFPKSVSSSPVTYFVPQPQVLQQPACLVGELNQEPVQIFPIVPSPDIKLQPLSVSDTICTDSTSKLSAPINCSASALIQPVPLDTIPTSELSQSQSFPASLLQTSSNTLSSGFVSNSLPQSSISKSLYFTTPTNLPSINASSASPLPGSQHAVVSSPPVLLPVVGNTSQLLIQPHLSSVPLTISSIGTETDLNPYNLALQAALDSSSVLRSTSSSPFLASSQTVSQAHSSDVLAPAVLEPSATESSTSLKTNIHVGTSFSENNSLTVSEPQKQHNLVSFIFPTTKLPEQKETLSRADSTDLNSQVLPVNLVVSDSDISIASPPTVSSAFTHEYASVNPSENIASTPPPLQITSHSSSANLGEFKLGPESSALPSQQISSQLFAATIANSSVTQKFEKTNITFQPNSLSEPAVDTKPSGPKDSTESSNKLSEAFSAPLTSSNSVPNNIPVPVTDKVQVEPIKDDQLISEFVETIHPPDSVSPAETKSSFPPVCPTSPSPNLICESHFDKATLQETSDLNTVSKELPLTVSQTSTIQTSADHSDSQPALFTFTTPSTSSSFPDSYSHPPKQPYNKTNQFSSTRNLFQPSIPKSASAASNLPTDLGLFQEQALIFTSPPTSSNQDQPTLLDPSKFFSSFPSDTSTIQFPSIPETNFHPDLTNSNPPQLNTPPDFIPFPTRKFNIPSSPTLPVVTQTLSAPSFTKDLVSSQNLSTLSTSSTTVLSSHTPPPPYSSLSFLSNTADSQSFSNETIPPTSTQLQSDGTTLSCQGIGIVKDEELDQIPLDGNTVPFYNPHSFGPHYHQPLLSTKGVSSNSYRLGSGLKRPSYAPVPDLAITNQVSQVFPSMSSTPYADVNTTTAVTVTTPSLTPSSSVASSPPPESASFNYAVTAQGQIYRPAYHHWFFKKGGESKTIWQPFSMADSLNLEQVFTSPDLNDNIKVATDGGRYDVEVVRRRKIPVYWEEPPGEVRRCSWFVRAPIESRYIPYDENIAEILEDAYKSCCLKNEWNRRVELADGEVIILHSPNAVAHHQRSSSPDAWGNPPTMQQKPRLVKRGLEDFEIAEGEPNQVDHLLLMVHGIGKVCDLRFRSLVQVVDDFRSVSLQLVQSHFRSGTENGNVGRVEVLPVEWHRALHTEIIDKRLADITLPSIPKAREFTNDVLLDVLFYTSPVFCERIVQAVGAEINRVYNLYMTRNPGFRGGISLGGHSLGSLILFDMLCHQKPQRYMKSTFSPQSSIQEGDEDMPEVGCLKAKARLSRRMSYLTIGSAGTGQPYIVYPQLNFQPKAFFALGSPIGMFLTVRGIEGLGEEFKFPTCPKFFNIFHPHDPVAYRIEALVSPQMIGVPAVIIPHHKGRKRMHLELRDTMTHVTAALKQKLVDSMKSTWNTVYQLAMFHRPDSSIQQEVDKVIENEILSSTECDTTSSNQLILPDHEALNMKVGNINGGNRIDYVLQEAPLETFNQYISAVRSHVVYWESQDTMLLILKELYATLGISPDSQTPQPILPFDISSDTTGETYSEYTDSIGAPPTQFIRK